MTQIVRAGEAEVFHTRQQHTLKVAQVGRRLAERCKADYDCSRTAKMIDPEVVEAACLAHDLGHPPFGHIGESVLNSLVENAGDDEGFEGNAQSFRIITKLSVRFSDTHGLDLSRATLSACLKYPWMRDICTASKKKKWSAYKSESKDFDFAREYLSQDIKSSEATLMDYADDIAYSVHDLEDFHRCAALPWGSIFSNDGEKLIVDRAVKSWFDPPAGAEGQLREAYRRIKDLLEELFPELLREPYIGKREQRQQLRTLTSRLIGRYILKAAINDEVPTGIEIDTVADTEIRVLKQITREYIISNPSLRAQQIGQQKIIEGLFREIHDAHRDDSFSFLPYRLRYLQEFSPDSPARFAADCIASLTEREAIDLYGRLFGVSSGSVLDPIVR